MSFANFMASFYLRSNRNVNYSDVQMKMSRLLVFLCSYSACKEEHHNTVWSFVKVYIDRETEHIPGSQNMVSAESIRPCGVVSA